MAKISELLENVYPLADALQMSLGVYSPASKPQRLVNVGKPPAREVKLSEGLEIPVKCDVLCSHISKDAGAVLVFLREDLFVFVTYERKDKSFVMDIVDGKQGGLSRDTLKKLDGSDLDELEKAIIPGIVASFTKPLRASKWEPLEHLDHEPDSVDA